MPKRNPARNYADEVPTYPVLLAMLTGAVAKLTVADRRLDRIAALHGLIGNLCNQCGEPHPCRTRQVLSEHISGVDPDVSWQDRRPDKQAR